MKKILLFAFLLYSFSAFAQYPAQPTTKQELGRQTTGDGLIYRGSGAPAYTPSNNRNAWIYYDTTNNRLYKSRLGSWSLMIQDTSAFNELQLPYIVDDTLYLTSNATGEPLTAYVNRVWPIAALSDTTTITGENQGDVAFVTGGTAVAFRGSAYWYPFSGGGGGGSFNDFIIAGDTGSSTITDGQTVTVAGGYGINTAESGGTVTVTADTSQLVTPSDIAGLTPITASNGLTKTGNDIALGGTLTANTAISGASSYDLDLTALDSLNLSFAKRLLITQNANRFLHQTGGGSGASVFENLFIGYQAGQNAPGNGTGYANTVIGRRAGFNMSLAWGAGSGGSSNTILGYGAAEALTSGSANTILGTAAGTAITTSGGNIMIGWHAGINAPSGNHNIFMGFEAGKVNTQDENIYLGKNVAAANNYGAATKNVFVGTDTGTTGDSITNSVLIGHSAGKFVDGVSNENVIIGKDAGSGSGFRSQGNVIIGSSAGKAITTGVNNTVIGRNAGLLFTTASRNTIIGQGAFGGIATGVENTAIGALALAANTSGYGNVSIGYTALQTNTTGYNNLGLGTAALFANTTGFRNNAFGISALQSNTTGSDNAAFGTSSLLYIAGASAQNVAMGYAAGALTASAGNVTSANNSVFVGALSRANAAGETNQNVFGYLAVGRGSNTTTLGNSSITSTKAFGTFEAGTLSGTANKIGGWTSGNIATTIAPTITTAGTTGDVTIKQLAGTVNIAAAGTTVTVTNSLVTANSLVFCTLRTNDATATVKNCVPAAGSFVINLGAAATGEVSIGFFVVN